MGNWTFVNRMVEEAAAREFARQTEERRAAEQLAEISRQATALRVEQARLAAEQIAAQERVAAEQRAELDRQVALLIKEAEAERNRALARANLVEQTNVAGIHGLENGKLDDVKAVFDTLEDEERAIFMNVQPLEKSLVHKQLVVAEYLVDKGFSCDDWDDFVDDKSSTLAIKLDEKSSARSMLRPH